MSNLSLFSIYKIDFQKFSSIQGIDISSENAANKILDLILVNIKNNINQKEDAAYDEINADGVNGVVYRTIHQPEWNEFINALRVHSNNRIKKKSNVVEIENINVSYILFYISSGNLYAMTAGYGNHLIKEYVVKNWGLYLLPKMMDDNSGVIREVKQSNLFGNALSTAKANRNNTDFAFESEMSTIFKELNVELNKDNIKDLGIECDEKKNKKMSVLMKDSLNIRKAISLQQLKKVIDAVVEIEKRDDNFSLGYLVETKKRGINNIDLFQQLQNDILNHTNDANFQLIGDDYIKYCVDAYEYIIKNERGEDIFTNNEPIFYKDFLDFIYENEKMTKASVERILKKWTISTKDDIGNDIMFPKSIFSSLQGFIEYGNEKIPCFLIQGQWYCIDYSYKDIMDNEFSNIYEEDKSHSERLKKEYRLTKNIASEDKYNDDFFEDKNIIVGHKSLISNFEIADLLFWDDDNLYLMCNKGHFNGSGSRDLTNQIYASAYYLRSILFSTQKTLRLDELYTQIEKRYKSKGKTIPVSKDLFSLLFDKKITYIAGYMSGYRNNTDSYYAKYLSLDIKKRMKSLGYECILLNVNEI